MRRRKFIVLTTATAAALGVSFWYVNRHLSDSGFIIATPESLASIWDTETMDGMGSEYLKLWPEENSAPFLKNKLEDLILHSPYKERAIQLAIQDDFRKGRTVIVDGWILARTEARQCALSSLIQTK